MKNNWSQPSLSRDFALLSAGVIFLLFLVSAWVSYNTYSHHSDRIGVELDEEATRIERALAGEMESANYLLTSLGRQIVLDNDRAINLYGLARTLKSFDSKGSIYSIFSWVNPDQQILVSSNHGILDKPVDISDRDYVKQSQLEPWKMHVGQPIKGRVSERWVIPVALGVTDSTGKFIGSIMISLDIEIFTEHLNRLTRREGVSFAIVGKTLIPITEVSDDKDFVVHNFPAAKLASVDFAANPTGIINQGNPFWGAGIYSYYRVSQEYPYIILLGYNPHFSDATLRSTLWARLAQVTMMAGFLLLFLWIMRVRMIKPVIEMTASAEAIAKGNAYIAPRSDGPVEIEGLASQIRRISEYIQETKRVENELRNKMFMLKKAKETAEIDKRGKTEFLAYICQEMRSPLNNIIGFAQVMRDQLYGPIENRKYRQYAADIYQTGNSLLGNLQELLTLSKVESGYIELSEKPVDVAEVINKAVRFVADRLQADKSGINVKLQDPLPKLVADEFRLQQIFMNLILYALAHMPPGTTLSLEAKTISENRDRSLFAVILSTHQESPQAAELFAIANRLANESPYAAPREVAHAEVSLNAELAKLLVAAHHGWLDIQHAKDALTIAVFFAGNRIRNAEPQDY